MISNRNLSALALGVLLLALPDCGSRSSAIRGRLSPQRGQPAPTSQTEVPRPVNFVGHWEGTDGTVRENDGSTHRSNHVTVDVKESTDDLNLEVSAAFTFVSPGASTSLLGFGAKLQRKNADLLARCYDTGTRWVKVGTVSATAFEITRLLDINCGTAPGSLSLTATDEESLNLRVVDGVVKKQNAVGTARVQRIVSRTLQSNIEEDER